MPNHNCSLRLAVNNELFKGADVSSVNTCTLDEEVISLGFETKKLGA